MLPSKQVADNGNSYVELMPNEVILEIFGCLSSFSHVFALAATSRRLRDVWAENVAQVYGPVALRSIACENYARRFRADQRGSAVNGSALSVRDVQCIARNSQIVDKAILQFERQIVCKVKAPGFPLAEVYGAGTRRHPPHLTKAERRRFVRTYYQLWGLMKLDVAQSQAARLEAMTLKQLYHLCEMSMLTQNIGREEDVPVPLDLRQNPDSTAAIDHRRSKERRALAARIWKHLEQTFLHIHHEDADYVWLYAKEDGFLSSVVIWDHWQTCLKEVVCGRQVAAPSPRPDFEKRYMWDDSSDEET